MSNKDNKERTGANEAPAPLVWRTAFESGFVAIDAEHRELFNLANDLLKLAENYAADPNAFNYALGDFMLNLQRHLKHEEAFMREVGYDLTTHSSKSLDAFNGRDVDVAVTMGCGDACPLVRARRREDWDIPDPKDMSADDYRTVRDLIERKVKDLLNALEPAAGAAKE